MGACVEIKVPCVLKQIVQWQKCTGIGREEVGRVNVRIEEVQWHVALKVRSSEGVVILGVV
jgi:hypothetical protein